LKVDELKNHLRTLKTLGRKNATLVGKKADLVERFSRIAREEGIDLGKEGWNAELAARGGAKVAAAKRGGGVTTRAGAALARAEAARNAALEERNRALKNLNAAKKALETMREERNGVARNRNVWMRKATALEARSAPASTKRAVAFDIPAKNAMAPGRIEKRLAPKHAFIDDRGARARARQEAARARRMNELWYKTEFARGRLAYGDYVRAKKLALDEHVSPGHRSNMLVSNSRQKAELPRRDKKDRTRADVRGRVAAEKRREAAARASREATERALRRARQMRLAGAKRVAQAPASGAANRAAKRAR
jgi:hypothetical protein